MFRNILMLPGKRRMRKYWLLIQTCVYEVSASILNIHFPLYKEKYFCDNNELDKCYLMQHKNELIFENLLKTI